MLPYYSVYGSVVDILLLDKTFSAECNFQSVPIQYAIYILYRN